jgi:hypothetical protein
MGESQLVRIFGLGVERDPVKALRHFRFRFQFHLHFHLHFLRHFRFHLHFLRRFRFRFRFHLHFHLHFRLRFYFQFQFGDWFERGLHVPKSPARALESSMCTISSFCSTLRLEFEFSFDNSDAIATRKNS